MSNETLLDEVKRLVRESLADLDGVLALRVHDGDVAPHLYKNGDGLDDVVLEPRFPMALVVDALLDAYPDARLGVVARGCDQRAIVELIKRDQIDAHRVEVIGYACTGEQAVACRCAKPYADSPISVGERAEGVADGLVAEYESKSPEERQAFWRVQFSKCYKCYGCRTICPECFCEHCVLEDDMWVERGELAPPFPAFHLIRAMHTVGKCVGCGQCEDACPADIPLTVLYSLLRRDVKELFDYEPGASVEDRPPLAVAMETV